MTDNIANISGDKALSALRAYVRATDAYDFDPLSTDRKHEVSVILIDLLCDLRHLCRREGVSFDEADQVAAEYHAEEVA